MSQFVGKLRKLLNRAGLDVRRYPICYDPDHVRQRLLSELKISLILDVGANIGQYAKSVFFHGYSGKMVSFEPLTEEFNSLRETGSRSGYRWQCRKEGLGDSNAALSINVSSTMSSLLPKSKTASDAVTFNFDRTEQISVRRLDSIWSEFAAPKDTVWLKIDVQGYEAQVLNGAGGILPKITAVEMELSLWPFYDGQPLYTEMISIMREAGFDLWSLSPGSRNHAGQMVEMDGIFVRRIGEELQVTPTERSEPR